MERNTVDVMGIPVDNVIMSEAVDAVLSFLDQEGVHTVFTPNAEMMMAAGEDRELEHILKNADLVIPDGAGVVLASRILGKGLREKVAGFDLVKSLLTVSERRKIKFFLFGGMPGTAEAAAEKILSACPGAEIAGTRNGYFSRDEESEIVALINSSKADILLVALGAPKQEKWIYAHRGELKVKVCMGVGGTLDAISGKVKPAPEFFRRNGLEWLYRLCREPRRFKRMLALPRYILKAVGRRIGGKPGS